MPDFKNNPDAGLIVLMAASACVYLYWLKLDAINGLRPVAVFLCAMLVLFLLYGMAARVVRQARRGTWKWVAAGAVLFRLILLPAGLPAEASAASKLGMLRRDAAGQEVTFERFQLFDDDIWRYLWDGHVAAAGVNPYATAPASAALDALAADPPWSDIRDNVSYPAVATIYPPLAQAVFRFSHWIAPSSVLAMKSLLTVFDLTAAGLVGLTLRATGADPAWALLYAWNPLVVKVFAGSGHVDAVAVACLSAMAYCLAKAAPARAAMCLGLAILAKLSPLILIPFFWRRAGWRNAALAVGVTLAGYLPFLGAGARVFGGLGTFGQEWQFNAGVYSVFRWMAAPFATHAYLVAKAACGVVLGAILVHVWRSGRPSATLAKEAAPAVGFLVLLSPTAMPWYATWALPFAVIEGQRFWMWWTGLICVAFLVMIDGVERPLLLALEYGALALAAFLDFRFQDKRKT